MGNGSGGRPPANDDDGAVGSLLRLEGIAKSFCSGDSEIRVLEGIDFDLARGEFVAVNGPSGAGKSTLLHIAAGLDTPTEGSVYFDGWRLSDMSDGELTNTRRLRFGFVFQFFNLVPGLDVLDNVALPLLFAGVARREAARIATEAIAAVGLAHRTGHLVAALSGGEMQRVAVARAVAPRPDVVFADEPTGNLDSENGANVLRLLTDLTRERGTSLLMVTHDDRAAGGADRIVELRDGRLTVGEPRSPLTAHVATDSTAG